MTVFDIIQLIASVLLAVYIIGALYWLIAVGTFTLLRKRNHEVRLIVDVVSRILVVAYITFFWPLHILQK